MCLLDNGTDKHCLSGKHRPKIRLWIMNFKWIWMFCRTFATDATSCAILVFSSCYEVLPKAKESQPSLTVRSLNNSHISLCLKLNIRAENGLVDEWSDNNFKSSFSFSNRIIFSKHLLIHPARLEKVLTSALNTIHHQQLVVCSSYPFNSLWRSVQNWVWNKLSENWDELFQQPLCASRMLLNLRTWILHSASRWSFFAYEFCLHTALSSHRGL